MTKAIDLTGHRYGRLLVLNQEPSKAALKWKVRCDCGVEKIVVGNNMRQGGTTSCGCLTVERIKEAKTTHGQSWKCAEYNIWVGLRQRCNNYRHPRYKDYGGRGITVDTAWDSYTQFVADMGPRPTNKHTIDRINNDLGYSKNNCRWATYSEQAFNRRKKRNMT